MGTNDICIIIPLGHLNPISFMALAAALMACWDGAVMPTATSVLMFLLLLLALFVGFVLDAAARMTALRALARTAASEGAVALLPPPRPTLPPLP